MLFSTGTGLKQGFQGTVFVASSMQNAMVLGVMDKVCMYRGVGG